MYVKVSMHRGPIERNGGSEFGQNFISIKLVAYKEV